MLVVNASIIALTSAPVRSLRTYCTYASKLSNPPARRRRCSRAFTSAVLTEVRRMPLCSYTSAAIAAMASRVIVGDDPGVISYSIGGRRQPRHRQSLDIEEHRQVAL